MARRPGVYPLDRPAYDPRLTEVGAEVRPKYDGRMRLTPAGGPAADSRLSFTSLGDQRFTEVLRAMDAIRDAHGAGVLTDIAAARLAAELTEGIGSNPASDPTRSGIPRRATPDPLFGLGLGWIPDGNSGPSEAAGGRHGNWDPFATDTDVGGFGVGGRDIVSLDPNSVDSLDEDDRNSNEFIAEYWRFAPNPGVSTPDDQWVGVETDQRRIIVEVERVNPDGTTVREQPYFVEPPPLRGRPTGNTPRNPDPDGPPPGAEAFVKRFGLGARVPGLNWNPLPRTGPDQVRPAEPPQPQAPGSPVLDAIRRGLSGAPPQVGRGRGWTREEFDRLRWGGSSPRPPEKP